MVIKKDQPIMTLLIAFFLVLALIAIFVHFCASEAKGQTPPMNPVNIDWTVNPLALYLDIFDTYWQLQRLSAESDTVYLTIDSLAAHKDTLHGRIDSLDSQTDTLALEIDTLRLRVDSIQTSRDSIFFAYDAAGGLLITSTEDDTVSFDTEVRKDAIYVHAADGKAVACNSAGWYKVDYSVGLKNATGGNLGLVVSQLIRYSSGWSTVLGTRSYSTLSASTLSYANLNASVCVELVSGDSLAINVTNNVPADNAETVAYSVRLRIEKLH